MTPLTQILKVFLESTHTLFQLSRLFNLVQKNQLNSRTIFFFWKRLGKEISQLHYVVYIFIMCVYIWTLFPHMYTHCVLITICFKLHDYLKKLKDDKEQNLLPLNHRLIFIMWPLTYFIKLSFLMIQFPVRCSLYTQETVTVAHNVSKTCLYISEMTPCSMRSFYLQCF